MPTRGQGVDISNYSGELTPELCRNLRAEGFSFVIVRLSEENKAGQRSIAAEQIATLEAAGMPWVGYIWAYWEEDPNAVAERALALLSHQTHYDGNLLWFDCEDDVPVTCDPAGWLRAAGEAVRAAGYAPGIYTGAWWWASADHARTLAGSTEFADWPLWVAKYDGDPDLRTFSPFGGWVLPMVKQYAGDSTVGGVPMVDKDSA